MMDLTPLIIDLQSAPHIILESLDHANETPCQDSLNGIHHLMEECPGMAVLMSGISPATRKHGLDSKIR